MYSLSETQECHYKKSFRRISYEKETYSGIAMLCITADNIV